MKRPPKICDFNRNFGMDSNTTFYIHFVIDITFVILLVKVCAIVTLSFSHLHVNFLVITYCFYDKILYRYLHKKYNSQFLVQFDVASVTYAYFIARLHRLVCWI